jgi:predicted metal-dependent phosphoesterase TrpH
MELDLEAAQMYAGLRALADAAYIDLESPRHGPEMVGGYISQVRERTRRELGSWPSADSVVDQLVEALSQAAESEPEPERKSRLRSAADLLGGMARDIAVAAVSSRLG